VALIHSLWATYSGLPRFPARLGSLCLASGGSQLECRHPTGIVCAPLRRPLAAFDVELIENTLHDGIGRAFVPSRIVIVVEFDRRDGSGAHVRTTPPAAFDKKFAANIEVGMLHWRPVARPDDRLLLALDPLRHALSRRRAASSPPRRPWRSPCGRRSGFSAPPWCGPCP
jgi:hypothetical protein